ncbi:GNAT family N-acetyltransferase [Candidatus Pacearchaeota archaeon]|nr:GNAT family N-acetyltransferase [Candidatus Pacearchaeota archaeon]
MIATRKMGACVELKMAGGKLVYHTKPGGVTEIVDIEVAEASRRKGIGGQLVKAVASCVGEHSVIHVFTRRTNGIARLFYQSLGMFEVVIPGFYPNEDACLFVNKERP